MINFEKIKKFAIGFSVGLGIIMAGAFIADLFIDHPKIFTGIFVMVVCGLYGWIWCRK